MYTWQVTVYHHHVFALLLISLVLFIAGHYRLERKIYFDTGQGIYGIKYFRGLWKTGKDLPQSIVLKMEPVLVKRGIRRRTGIRVYLVLEDEQVFLKEFPDRQTPQIPAFLKETEEILKQAGVKSIRRRTDKLVKTFKNAIP